METLEQTKRRVRGSFLGRSGIHGVGISRQSQAIRVYVDEDCSVDADLLSALKNAANPFEVVLINQKRAERA